MSENVYSNVGVRQDDNLSPILFALFLNDLVEFICNGFDDLSDITEAIHLLCDNEDIEVYFKLYLLLYADDTVILADSKEQLQAALNSMHLYCQTWKLEHIAVVEDFVYLGVTFTHNGSFANIKAVYWNKVVKLCLVF